MFEGGKHAREESAEMGRHLAHMRETNARARLRDEFAMAALTGASRLANGDPASIAGKAYAIADAMLEARGNA
jgi:hypothetical protein